MTESSGNPNADSGYQRGLMQMSKFQLIDINRVYGTSFTYDDMFDPEMAVDAGTQYLQYWMKYWHKLYASEYVATHLSLLTYAWGIGNVMNWLAKTPKDNQFIDESIPRDKKDYGENVTFWTVYSMYTFPTKDLDDISVNHPPLKEVGACKSSS